MSEVWVKENPQHYWIRYFKAVYKGYIMVIPIFKGWLGRKDNGWWLGGKDRYIEKIKWWCYCYQGKLNPEKNLDHNKWNLRYIKVDWNTLFTSLLWYWVCVCVTGYQSLECVQIMRWWSSNLGQRPLWNLGSVDNVMSTYPHPNISIFLDHPRHSPFTNSLPICHPLTYLNHSLQQILPPVPVLDRLSTCTSIHSLRPPLPVPTLDVL